MTPLTIMAADDHQLFLQGVSSLLNDVDSIKLIGTYPNSNDLLSAFQANPCELVLMDLSMPSITSEQLLEGLKAISSEVKIIALTMHCDALRAMSLFNKGLNGYVLKDAAFDELIQAIELVGDGQQYVSCELQAQINAISGKQSNQCLTEREKAVLTQVAKGLSNKEIARLLNITERTVRFHLSNCYVKLNVNSRMQATSLAQSRNLISF